MYGKYDPGKKKISLILQKCYFYYFLSQFQTVLQKLPTEQEDTFPTPSVC